MRVEGRKVLYVFHFVCYNSKLRQYEILCVCFFKGTFTFEKGNQYDII